jgi:hypothetical protein
LLIVIAVVSTCNPLLAPTWKSHQAFLANHNFWDPHWAAAFGTLLGTGSTFWFERRRRDDERRAQLRHAKYPYIKDRQQILYYFGLLQFQDAFQHAASAEFCIYMSNPDTKAIAFCRDINDLH